MSHAQPQTGRAILLMLMAIFCFTSMDACAKAIAAESNTVMALWARYTGQVVLVLAIVAPRLRQVAPYSGAMLAMVARCARGRLSRPGP